MWDINCLDVLVQLYILCMCYVQLCFVLVFYVLLQIVVKCNIQFFNRGEIFNVQYFESKFFGNLKIFVWRLFEYDVCIKYKYLQFVVMLFILNVIK